MKSLILIGFLVLINQAMAQLVMPSVFGDHMVLQAGKPVKLWGQASPGAKIEASLHSQTVSVEADAAGKWSLNLPMLQASNEGALLKVSDGKTTLDFKDVLIGEVWFASGQSNMEWRLKQIQAHDEIAAANNPEIRFYQAKMTAEGTPKDDVEGKWTVSSPETAAEYSAVAYYFAKKLHKELGVPVAIVQAAWGGKPVEAFTRREALLSIPEGKGMMEKQDEAIANFDETEAWRNYEMAQVQYEADLLAWNAKPENERKGRGPRKPRLEQSPGKRANLPATIWNGMIHPLAGYTIRGAIWYQGESNRRQPESYGALFELMIKDWRKVWGDDFSFLWAQLANFQDPVKEPGTNDGWAVVQEHQRLTLSLPKTGMAVINDIGDAKDIHPKNKLDVGERLARWALADEYGKNIIKSGPLYASHVIDGGNVVVNFNHVGKGLKSRDGKALQRFEIQDKDGNWYWADAKIAGNSVVISHPEVKEAAAARYAWAANPEGANLVNSEGLPTSLFTTEWGNLAGQVSIPVSGKALVTYQAAPLENPFGGDKFKGSNFIHPLKTPSGFVVTDSQPKDHPHHFGLWWPWKYIEYDGRKILCWELQQEDGIIEARETDATGNGLITKSVYIDRKTPAGATVRLHETTEISTSAIVDTPASGYFLDLAIHHEVAGEEPITISKYRYSGLGYRGSALWDKHTSTILTSEGAVRADANAKAARWIRIEGTNGLGGSAGVLMMGHPGNPSHPEKLRTWNERFYNGAIFINFNPVMDQAWILEPGQTYTRKYRLFVYDGELSKEDAETIWNAYAKQ